MAIWLYGYMVKLLNCFYVKKHKPEKYSNIITEVDLKLLQDDSSLVPVFRPMLQMIS
jgi:hypothetical protein